MFPLVDISSLEFYETSTIVFSIVRLIFHVIIGAGGGFAYNYLSKGDVVCNNILCELKDGLKYLVGGATIVEVLGAPVDIFNLWMMLSSNTANIAKGLFAPVFNWVYMVLNFIVMGTLGYLYMNLLWDKVNSIGGVFAPLAMALVINFPGLLLLANQANALLYIYESRNGADLVTDVIFV